MRPRLIWPEVKSNSAVQCVVVRVMGCVCIGDTIRFTTLHGQHYGQAVFGDRWYEGFSVVSRQGFSEKKCRRMNRFSQVIQRKRSVVRYKKSWDEYDSSPSLMGICADWGQWLRCGESERQGEEEIEVGRMREKRKSVASLATTVRRKMMEKRGEISPRPGLSITKEIWERAIRVMANGVGPKQQLRWECTTVEF